MGWQSIFRFQSMFALCIQAKEEIHANMQLNSRCIQSDTDEIEASSESWYAMKDDMRADFLEKVGATRILDTYLETFGNMSGSSGDSAPDEVASAEEVMLLNILQ